MIDKDQVPAIIHMIKTFYEPVMMRALVNLVLIDMSHLTMGGKGPVKEILMSELAMRTLIDSLEVNHRPRKHDLIDLILAEYGLKLLKDEQDFYHHHMGALFDTQADHVAKLLRAYKYKDIHNLSKMAVN